MRGLAQLGSERCRLAGSLLFAPVRVRRSCGPRWSLCSGTVRPRSFSARLIRRGSRKLTADVLGAEPDGELLKMAQRAVGSPFLLVELLSGLREEGLVRIESGRAELVEWRLPHRVSQSMRLRLERMSDGARQVATVAAALGRRFSLDDVAAMSKPVAIKNFSRPLTS